MRAKHKGPHLCTCENCPWAKYPARLPRLSRGKAERIAQRAVPGVVWRLQVGKENPNRNRHCRNRIVTENGVELIGLFPDGHRYAQFGLFSRTLCEPGEYLLPAVLMERIARQAAALNTWWFHHTPTAADRAVRCGAGRAAAMIPEACA